MAGARARWRVETVRNEAGLRYLDWVESNRRRVSEASGGRLGYVHLPDTYVGSAVNFPRLFYVQTRKQGLVVDGRFNGGGLDPDIFLQRLAKRPLNYWTRRYSNHFTNPLVSTSAHMVMLTNRQAGSGGDMLPAQFRQLGLGPVIGTRTWGGLVGVSMFLQLMDGGGLTAPDYRVYDGEGRWHIEKPGRRAGRRGRSRPGGDGGRPRQPARGGDRAPPAAPRGGAAGVAGERASAERHLALPSPGLLAARPPGETEQLARATRRAG